MSDEDAIVVVVLHRETRLLIGQRIAIAHERGAVIG
jgi:hypothetical protein